MNEPERDALLEAWLRRRSTLHEELAKLDRDEPPEELDRIVLERAHRAIRRRRSPEPLRQLRWALPVGLAATLILSFVLLLQITPSRVRPTAASNPLPADSAEYRTLEAQSASSEAPTSSPVSPPTTPPASAAPMPAESASRRAPAASAAAADPQVSAPSEGVSERSRADVSAQQSERSMTGSGEAIRTREAWLAEIESLRARGLLAEAERELAAFRQVYPDGRPSPAAVTSPDR
jgi:cytoskeletal protein RodZ